MFESVMNTAKIKFHKRGTEGKVRTCEKCQIEIYTHIPSYMHKLYNMEEQEEQAANKMYRKQRK